VAAFLSAMKMHHQERYITRNCGDTKAPQQFTDTTKTVSTATYKHTVPRGVLGVLRRRCRSHNHRRTQIIAARFVVPHMGPVTQWKLRALPAPTDIQLLSGCHRYSAYDLAGCQINFGVHASVRSCFGTSGGRLRTGRANARKPCKSHRSIDYRRKPTERACTRQH
jgi:hypothetical protein